MLLKIKWLTLLFKIEFYLNNIINPLILVFIHRFKDYIELRASIISFSINSRINIKLHAMTNLSFSANLNLNYDRLI